MKIALVISSSDLVKQISTKRHECILVIIDSKVHTFPLRDDDTCMHTEMLEAKSISARVT